METVKSVETQYYKIQLLQSKAGLYYIAYDSERFEEPKTTDGIKDFKSASIIFDELLITLEGN